MPVDPGRKVLAPRELGLAARPNLLTFDAGPEGQSFADVGFYVPTYMGPLSVFEAAQRMPRLQVMQLLTAGYESAVPYLPASAVLCNAAGVHDASTSELAVGLILASLRGIDDFARAMPQGEWLRGRRPALADSRVVIIGAGGVGESIRRRLVPFEVDVVVVGRTSREGVHGRDELDSLLPGADIVILAVPLGPDTTGMVDDVFLRRMKAGALLVNVARGGVVDTDALVAHCAHGRIRAALDVTDPEPLPQDHLLWTTPGVLVSPHVGGNSSAFLPRARRLVERQVQRWLAGQPMGHVVAGPAS
ncbi:MAG: 2-hydroxyacid dehydrogenase [Actinomycetes bacterium]